MCVCIVNWVGTSQFLVARSLVQEPKGKGKKDKGNKKGAADETPKKKGSGKKKGKKQHRVGCFIGNWMCSRTDRDHGAHRNVASRHDHTNWTRETFPMVTR